MKQSYSGFHSWWYNLHFYTPTANQVELLSNIVTYSPAALPWRLPFHKQPLILIQSDSAFSEEIQQSLL